MTMTLNYIRGKSNGSFFSKTSLILILAGCLTFHSSNAQEKSTGPVTPLFQSDEILNLSLEADFDAVFANTDDSTNFPAKFTVTDNSGQKRTIDIKVRTRGITRRKKNICRFAPLRLSFPKEQTKNTLFEGQKSLKLVTHCDKQDFYEQNVIMEYLIYKAFNVLTDSSLKVRPAIIDYIYPDPKEDTVRKFAYFIEREKNLAERLKGVDYQKETIHPARMDPFQTCLVDIFEYMIGNTDYSIYDIHNIMIVTDSLNRYPAIPVPYDFDWSGMVSANYAVPNPMLNTEYVTERVYRGLKKDPEVVNRVIRLFNARKQAIYNVFENYALLNIKEKKQAVKYLDEFYAIINDERQVKTEFFDKARTVDK